MAEIITCPACQRKLQVPEAVFGKMVQCPECRHQFVAEAPPDPAFAPPSRPPPPALPPEDPPRRRRAEEGDDDFAERRPIRATVYPHRGTVILTLGIMSLVIPCVAIICGPIAWSMANSDLAEMRAGRMDPDGEGIVQAGRILGMIALGLLALVALFYCGIFGIAVLGGAMQG